MSDTYRTKTGDFISWKTAGLNNNVQVTQQWVDLINVDVSNVSTRAEGKLTVDQAFALIKDVPVELAQDVFWYQASDTLCISRRPNVNWVTVHAFVAGGSGITMDIPEPEFRELLTAVQELAERLSKNS